MGLGPLAWNRALETEAVVFSIGLFRTHLGDGVQLLLSFYTKREKGIDKGFGFSKDTSATEL